MYLSTLFLEECFGDNHTTDPEKVRLALLSCENELFGRKDLIFVDATDPKKPLCRELIDLYDCSQEFEVEWPDKLKELVDTAVKASGLAPYYKQKM